MVSGGGERRIRLYCPLLPNILASLVVWEEQKLDLGSIASTFGIVPATLKINGHFISRGVDLIASSVTWKSLLSFFSARGLSTGEDNSNALIVDGKLCCAGTKRSYEPQDIESESHSLTEHKVSRVSRTQLEDFSLKKKKRLCESYSGFNDHYLQVNDRDGSCLKRKQKLEDLNHMKKLKMKETNLDISPKGFRGNENDLFGSSSRTNLSCTYKSDEIKRVREDDIDVISPCKKMRYG